MATDHDPNHTTPRRKAKYQMAQEVAARNPNVDVNDVADAMELIRELRRMGISGADYNLSSPHGPTRIHSAEEGPWREPC